MFGLLLALALLLAASTSASAGAGAAAAAPHVRISLHLRNRHEVERAEGLLRRCQQNRDGCHVDVWTRGSTFGVGANDVVVDGAQALKLLREVFEGNALRVVSNDVQADVVRHVAENRRARVSANNSYYGAYRTFPEILDHLSFLESTYSEIVEIKKSIGKTIEGRDIPAVVLRGGNSVSRLNATAKAKPVLYFQGCQHAREWISPAVVMYLIEELCRAYSEKEEAASFILDNADIHVIPVVNPDGYIFTEENRLWRKNRRRNSGGTYGVDLNRNWDDHWGGSGSSSNPSSDTYRGTGAFSEPESTAASSYISGLQKDQTVLAAVDWHAYSQLLLRPYGWTSQPCKDEAALKQLGAGVAYAIQNTHGKIYQNIRSIELYVTTGSAGDWFYQENIWAAYTVELRDTGAYGFLLPPNQIIPTAQENWNGMKLFWTEVLKTSAKQ